MLQGTTDGPVVPGGWILKNMGILLCRFLLIQTSFCQIIINRGGGGGGLQNENNKKWKEKKERNKKKNTLKISGFNSYSYFPKSRGVRSILQAYFLFFLRRNDVQSHCPNIKKGRLWNPRLSPNVFSILTSAGSRARALKSSMRRKSSTRFHLYDSFIWLRSVAPIAKGLQ